MKLLLAGVLLLLMTHRVAAGPPANDTGVRAGGHLATLLDEALANNPEIRTAIHEMGRAAYAAKQQGTFDDPVLMYEREEMPGFRWNEPMMHRIGFLQTIRFPTKLGDLDEIARIDVEHAHHMHVETVNQILMQVKLAYYDLWFAGESIKLNRESAGLLRQFVEIAQTKYSVGERGQQDALMAMVEHARIENELLELTQQHRSAKAALMALLNREEGDSLISAEIESEVFSLISLDSIEILAVRHRPILIHDSLTIQQKQIARSLSGDEYLPDLMLGVEYVKRVDLNRDAWTVKAGITLQFFPWTLGKASGRVEEAEAELSKSRSLLVSTRNMVLASVRDQYLKAESARKRLHAYDQLILPQARQAFEVTLIAYQTGRTDFLELIDSYRTLIAMTAEVLEVRRQFESAVAGLQQAVGSEQIVSQ